MTLNEAFAIRAKKILKEKNITQYSLHYSTNIAHSTLNSIFHAKTNASNFKTMALIIRELGVSIAEFFNDPLFDFDNLEIE